VCKTDPIYDATPSRNAVNLPKGVQEHIAMRTISLPVFYQVVHDNGLD